MTKKHKFIDERQHVRTAYMNITYLQFPRKQANIIENTIFKVCKLHLQPTNKSRWEQYFELNRRITKMQKHTIVDMFRHRPTFHKFVQTTTRHLYCTRYDTMVMCKMLKHRQDRQGGAPSETSKHIRSEAYKQLEEEIAKEFQISGIDMGAFPACIKCRTNKFIESDTRQTRSADEGSTVFLRCTQCRSDWWKWG